MRRGELKRTTPLRATGAARLTVKLRKCAVKECRQPFTPTRSFVNWCSPDCGAAIATAKLAKEREAKARRESAEHRAKLADSKKLAHWLKVTERVVNHYILTRDANQPCISCGATESVLFQAGHYLSVGARPELRFNPLNINKQCHRCNVHLSGNQAAYRPGLVAKAGLGAVQELEGPHVTAKYTREALEELRKQFAAETRALKQQMEQPK